MPAIRLSKGVVLTALGGCVRGTQGCLQSLNQLTLTQLRNVHRWLQGVQSACPLSRSARVHLESSPSWLGLGGSHPLHWAGLLAGVHMPTCALVHIADPMTSRGAWRSTPNNSCSHDPSKPTPSSPLPVIHGSRHGPPTEWPRQSNALQLSSLGKDMFLTLQVGAMPRHVVPLTGNALAQTRPRLGLVTLNKPLPNPRFLGQTRPGRTRWTEPLPEQGPFCACLGLSCPRAPWVRKLPCAYARGMRRRRCRKSGCALPNMPSALQLCWPAFAGWLACASWAWVEQWSACMVMLAQAFLDLHQAFHVCSGLTRFLLNTPSLLSPKSEDSPPCIALPELPRLRSLGSLTGSVDRHGTIDARVEVGCPSTSAPVCPGLINEAHTTATACGPGHAGKLGPEPFDAVLSLAATRGHETVVHTDTYRSYALSPQVGPLLRPLLWASCFLQQTVLSDAVPASSRLAHKRAYNRAVARASASPQQGTWYRGRWHTLRSLAQPSAPTVPSGRKLSPTPTRQGCPSDPRLRVLSWNSGGLSSEAYMELLQALEAMPPQTRPHVMLVQESHWATASEYNTGSWRVISDPCDPPSSGGLLTLVHRSVCSETQISFSTLVPGRLQHVRLELRSTNVDILHVYQKVYQSGAAPTGQPSYLDARRRVWDCLQQALSTLPLRHVWVVAGDFNTGVQGIPGLVGSRVRVMPARAVPDQKKLQDILTNHQLLHLNSWTLRARCTFHSPQGNSLIDHILTRKDLGDSRARRACPIPWELCSWRSGGKHQPVQASIPLPRSHRLNARTHPVQPFLDVGSLAAAARKPGDPRVRKLRQGVAEHLACQPCTLDQLNQVIRREALAHFPAQKRHGIVVPWQAPQVSIIVKHMWASYRAWRNSSPHGLRAVFSTWRRYARFRTAHRAFRKAGRQAKRTWLRQHAVALETCARKGDTHALFSTVARIARKRRTPAVQLRGPSGELWSPAKQLQALHDFYTDLYKRVGHPVASPTSVQFQISAAELLHQFNRLPVHKAAPAHLAPVAAWVACSDIVAPWLADTVSSLSSVPQLWRDSWLALLPKVAQPTLPKQLRPIGLTEVTGRAIAGIIQHRLRPYVLDYLRSWPQYAYVPNRGTADAVARVQQHCQQVADACTARVRTTVEARQGLPSPAVTGGGVPLSLDLTQAFDRLDWGLIRAQVPSDLRALVMTWLHGMRYHVSHRGHSTVVQATRGMKQGCKIAPLLWSLSTGTLMRDLAELTSRSWVQAHVTAYADDMHGAQWFTSVSELDEALSRLGCLLDLLCENHMVVNSTKSVVLLRATGRMLKQWSKRHIVKTEAGRALRLRTPAGRLFLFPLKEQHVYLGTIIAYSRTAGQVVTHRAQLAWQAWDKLRPLLTSKDAPGLRCRFRIWQACVPPTLLYGLAACPLRPRDVQALRQLCTRQLRALARAPAHLTRESNSALYARLRAKDPLQILLAEATRMEAKTWEEGTPASLTAAQWWRARKQQLQEYDQHMPSFDPAQPILPLASQPAPDSCLPPVHCPSCPAAFPTLRQLRLHQSKKHGHRAEARKNAIVYDRAKHSTQGMPTCSLCGHAFARWHHLKVHIVQGHCLSLLHDPPAPPVPAQHPSGTCALIRPGSGSVEEARNSEWQRQVAPAEVRPVIFRASIVQTLRSGGWYALLQDASLRDELRHHCPMCSCWFSSPPGVRLHLARVHAEWNALAPLTHSRAQVMRRVVTRPCRYCLQTRFTVDQRWKFCYMLNVCCFLDAYHNHDSQPGHGRGTSILRWVHRAGALSHDDTSKSAAHEHRPTCPGQEATCGGGTASHSEATQGAREGQRQERRNQGTGQGLVQSTLRFCKFMAGSPRGGSGGAGPHPAACASGAETRNAAGVPEAKHCYVPVLAYRRGHSVGRSVQCGAEVAATQGGRPLPTEAASQGGASALPGKRVARQTGGEASAGGELGGESQKSSLDESRGRVAILAMGRDSRATDPSRVHSRDLPGQPPAGYCSVPREHRQVSEHAPARGTPADGVGSVPVGSGAKVGGRQGVVHRSEVDQLGGLAPHRGSTSSGEAGLQWPGLGPAAVHPVVSPQVHSLKQALIRTPLHNPHNHCYTNTACLCALWAYACMPHPLPDAVARYTRWMRELSERTPISLLRYPPWHELMRGWRQPDRQHDLPEFLHHMIPQLQVSEYQGEWQARTVRRTRVHVHDGGQCCSPIALHLPTGVECTLQQCILRWHQQAAVHALSRVPAVLCIQLLRFQATKGASILKDHRVVRGLGGSLRVPVFVNSVSTHCIWLTFDVVAAGLHYGDKPSSGHYRAALRDGEKLWLTDDGLQARIVSVSDRTAIASSAYVLWCIRAPTQVAIEPSRHLTFTETS